MRKRRSSEQVQQAALQAMRVAKEPLSAHEIGGRARLDKGTTYRVVHILERSGQVERVGKRWKLNGTAAPATLKRDVPTASDADLEILLDALFKLRRVMLAGTSTPDLMAEISKRVK